MWQANAHDKDCPTTLDYNGVSYAVYHVTEEIGEDDLALVTPVAANVLYVAEGVTVDELPGDVAEPVAP